MEAIPAAVALREKMLMPNEVFGACLRCASPGGRRRLAWSAHSYRAPPIHGAALSRKIRERKPRNSTKERAVAALAAGARERKPVYGIGVFGH